MKQELILILSLIFFGAVIWTLIDNWKILLGFAVCSYLINNFVHKTTKAVTCSGNIHIFDDGKDVCKCWRMMKDGTTFSIPIIAQRTPLKAEKEGK